MRPKPRGVKIHFYRARERGTADGTERTKRLHTTQNPSLNASEKVYMTVKVHFQGQEGRQHLRLKAGEGFFRWYAHTRKM